DRVSRDRRGEARDGAHPSNALRCDEPVAAPRGGRWDPAPRRPIRRSLELVNGCDAFLLQAVPCRKWQAKASDRTFPTLTVLIGHVGAPLPAGGSTRISLSLTPGSSMPAISVNGL